MARTEVYINGKLADFNEIDLSFVYSVEDDDTLSVSGSHSKRSIKLPATKRNNDIFSNAILLQQPQNLNAGLLSLPARIVVDGIPVFIGSAQIDKAGITKLNSYYEVLFLSDNSNWIDQMRDVGMDTIEMDYDIDYKASNVMGSYISNSNSRDGGFTFFLPKVAKWQKPKQIQVDELYPAIFLEWIFYKAFANIGYTIQSNFLGTEYFRKLIIPILARNYDTKWLKGRTYGKLQIPQFTGYPNYQYTGYIGMYFASGTDNGQQLTVNNYLVGGTSYSQHVFRPRVNGKFKFKTYIYNPNTSEIQSVHLVRNGVVQRQVQTPITATNIRYFEQVLDLIIGDQVTFNGIFAAPPTGVSPVTSEVVIEYVSTISDSKVPNVTIGNYGAFNAIYEINQICKNWKLLDIISDTQKLFNLVFVTDTQKKQVTIEPRDYWIAHNVSGNPSNGLGLYTDNVDVTKMLDISKEIEVQYNPDDERYIIFNYNDNDSTVKAYEEDREGVKLYSHKYDRGKRFKNEEKEIKLQFFNKCMHIEDSEIWGDLNFNVLRRFQIPLLYSENQLKTPNPDTPDYNNQNAYLLYYYGPYVVPSYGEVSMPIVYYDKLTNYTWGQFPIVPLAFMNYYNDYGIPAITNNTANLSFAKEDKGHGLITDFHQRELERKAQNVKVEAFLRWSNIDIFNLDFKRKYVIKEIPYILKTIDGYNPATKTTTKTVFQVDTRLLKDGNNTNTEGIDSDLKGLIVI